jgi:hypothetical protein
MKAVPRKPTDIVQLKLRIRETLRRRIEAAAKKRQVSANYEMTSRLQQSFDQEAQRTIDAIAADIKTHWLRFGDAWHDLNKQGALWQAAEALIAALPAESRAREPVANAVAQVEQAIATIKIEAGKLARGMHT